MKPDGEPIRLDHQSGIEALLAVLREGSAEQCLSDFAFANLYLFREAHGYRFLPGEWPGVSGRTYDGTRHFMPLFDVRLAPVDVLRALIEAHGCLYPVPARCAGALSRDAFALSGSSDDSDYLYRASTFAGYAGRTLARKRNQARRFETLHAPTSQGFDSADAAAAARQVLQDWMAQKQKGAGEADELPCLEATAQARRFGLEGYLHFADGQPVGFVLAQELQPGVFAMRFAKGLDSHDGIYPFMFRHFCLHFERPVHWLNFEQDTGNAGFRRSKRSYQPAALLEKVRVRAKSG